MLDWLGTYALHSTALLAAVWLASRIASPALAERLWKLGLIGAALTATLQPVVGFEPLAGWLHVSSSMPTAAAALGALAPAGPSAATPAWLMPSWTGVALVAWAAVALLLLARLARLRLQLRRLLARRRELSASDLCGVLDRLGRRAGSYRRVRLSICDEVGVPVAIGVLRPEICVPSRALRELGADELETILAHELAHHLRGDPLWLWIARSLECLFFFQPLVFVAGRRLAELAELCCDARAVRLTRKPQSLAAGLTRVAAWGRRAPGLALASRLAVRRSGLARRVERLLDGALMRRERGPVWLAPLFPALLVVTVAAMPGVSSKPERRIEPVAVAALPEAIEVAESGPEVEVVVEIVEPEVVVEIVEPEVVVEIVEPEVVVEIVEPESVVEVVTEDDADEGSSDESSTDPHSELLREQLHEASDAIADAVKRAIAARRDYYSDEQAELLQEEIRRAKEALRSAQKIVLERTRESVRQLERLRSEHHGEIEEWKRDLRERLSKLREQVHRDRRVLRDEPRETARERRRKGPGRPR